MALRDPDPTFRHSAEEATNALAERAPAARRERARAGAAEPRRRRAARGPGAARDDRGARSGGLRLGARRVVANEQAPEEARVSALLLLRRAGAPSAELRPLLEKAVRPEASPRLRAAALPLYARLVTPEQAEEIARTEMKGSPAARAAGAAVWGTVAMTRPDLASSRSGALLYDPSTETRLEAARSFAYLKREGIELVEKATKDPNAEVEKAAIESAVALAPVDTYAVADLLGRAQEREAGGAPQRHRGAGAHRRDQAGRRHAPPLAHALKDPRRRDARRGGQRLLRAVGENAAAASPYLRVAARDEHDEVRTAAAACLGELSEADPKGAARIAAELGDATEAKVRVAAAESLGRLGAKARELAVPALLKLRPIPSARCASRPSARSAPSLATELDGLRRQARHRGRARVERRAGAGRRGRRRVVVSAAAKAGLRGLLRQASADGDESVRLDAVRAAGALGGRALEVVRGAVDDRANAVRAEATRILAAVVGRGRARGAAHLRVDAARRRQGGARGGRDRRGRPAGRGRGGRRLLGEALGQRSEALRTAAARALGRLAEREPEVALPTWSAPCAIRPTTCAAPRSPGWRSRGAQAVRRRARARPGRVRGRQHAALRRARGAGAVRRAGGGGDAATPPSATPPARRCSAPPSRGRRSRGWRRRLAAPSSSAPPDMHAFIERLLGP